MSNKDIAEENFFSGRLLGMYKREIVLYFNHTYLNLVKKESPFIDKCGTSINKNTFLTIPTFLIFHYSNKRMTPSRL